MKKIYFIMVVVISSLSLSPLANAQIKYVNNQLSINGGINTNVYDIAIDDCDRLSWFDRAGTHFVKIDLTASNPRFAGTGNNIVFYNTETSTFNQVQAAAFLQQSDARSKKNIKTISSGLDCVLSLRPVSYNWKINETDKSGENTTENDADFFGPDGERLQYGFLAQEVEEVLPDVVVTDDYGHKLINYSALVPMLVRAVQELQCTIDTQSRQIEELTNVNNSQRTSSKKSGKIESCVLSNGTLSVKVKLGKNEKKATVVVSTVTGRLVSTEDVSGDTVSMNVSDFNKGIYIISLSNDEKIIDSQRIIVE